MFRDLQIEFFKKSVQKCYKKYSISNLKHPWTCNIIGKWMAKLRDKKGVKATLLGYTQILSGKKIHIYAQLQKNEEKL